MRNTFAVNLALLFCSLLVGLVISEFVVRAVAPQPMSGNIFEYAPRGYAVNRSNGSAFFSIGDNNGTYYFTGPHLRGAIPAPIGAKRILVLGDSFTFGWELPEDDTYVAKLQAKIDGAFGGGRIALLNAGIGGSGTADHLAFLEDFGDEIAPAAVLVFVSIDDFARAERSPLYRLQGSETLDLTQGIHPRSWLKDSVKESKLYNFLIEHIQLAQLVRRSITVARLSSEHSTQSVKMPDSPYAFTEVTDDQKRLARALFRRMKAWCDARNVKIAVINNGWRRYDWLLDMLGAENITAYDVEPQLRPVLTKNINSFIIANDGHPDAKGATLIADAVWPLLRKFISESQMQ
jgi:lysophospholipase L1-like esterase